VAVIVTVPTCKIVTIEPATVAMFVSELAYENAPALFEVGGVIVKVPPLE
jgi:hypothetical protein